MTQRIRHLIALLGVAAAARALMRHDAVRVQGDSMHPTLRAGELLAVRPVRDGEPREGQIVVARLGAREIVKRVVEPPRAVASDEVWLEGDNAVASTDSRAVGSFARDKIVGIVRARYWPPARARLF